MKTIKLTLILTVLSFGTFAQTFEIPNYKLQNAEDYDTSENDIVNCVDWLMKTPINDQVDKRKDANAF
jgi:hypothetical protein